MKKRRKGVEREFQKGEGNLKKISTTNKYSSIKE
jgi:hypothetical protein